MKDAFFVLSGALAFIQFLVYTIVVRPYVGSLLDPHSAPRGYIELDDDVKFWTALASLSAAMIIYSALLLSEQHWGSERPDDRPIARLALLNIVMALGQLLVVMN